MTLPLGSQFRGKSTNLAENICMDRQVPSTRDAGIRLQEMFFLAQLEVGHGQWIDLVPALLVNPSRFVARPVRHHAATEHAYRGIAPYPIGHGFEVASIHTVIVIHEEQKPFTDAFDGGIERMRLAYPGLLAVLDGKRVISLSGMGFYAAMRVIRTGIGHNQYPCFETDGPARTFQGLQGLPQQAGSVVGTDHNRQQVCHGVSLTILEKNEKKTKSTSTGTKKPRGYHVSNKLGVPVAQPAEERFQLGGACKPAQRRPLGSIEDIPDRLSWLSQRLTQFRRGEITHHFQTGFDAAEQCVETFDGILAFGSTSRVVVAMGGDSHGKCLCMGNLSLSERGFGRIPAIDGFVHHIPNQIALTGITLVTQSQQRRILYVTAIAVSGSTTIACRLDMAYPLLLPGFLHIAVPKIARRHGAQGRCAKHLPKPFLRFSHDLHDPFPGLGDRGKVLTIHVVRLQRRIQ